MVDVHAMVESYSWFDQQSEQFTKQNAEQKIDLKKGKRHLFTERCQCQSLDFKGYFMDFMGGFGSLESFTDGGGLSAPSTAVSGADGDNTFSNAFNYKTGSNNLPWYAYAALVAIAVVIKG